MRATHLCLNANVLSGELDGDGQSLGPICVYFHRAYVRIGALSEGQHAPFATCCHGPNERVICIEDCRSMDRKCFDKLSLLLCNRFTR